MKKIFITLLLIMTYCLPTYANEQEVVASFQSFVNGIVAPIEANYNKGYYSLIPDNHDKPKRYYRAERANFLYSMDIKKTNSVMYPYIGILNLSSDCLLSKYYKTKEEAKHATDIRDIHHDIHRFAYKYSNGQWLEHNAYYCVNGNWYETGFYAISIHEIIPTKN